MTHTPSYPVAQKCCKGCTYCTLVHSQCSPGHKYHKCTAPISMKRECEDTFEEHDILDDIFTIDPFEFTPDCDID